MELTYSQLKNSNKETKYNNYIETFNKNNNSQIRDHLPHLSKNNEELSQVDSEISQKLSEISQVRKRWNLEQTPSYLEKKQVIQ